jgi:hypothetical protein
MAFANIYRDFFSGVVLHELGEDPGPAMAMLPNVDHGRSTMELIASAVASHDKGGVRVTLNRNWTEAPDPTSPATSFTSGNYAERSQISGWWDSSMRVRRMCPLRYRPASTESRRSIASKINRCSALTIQRRD